MTLRNSLIFTLLATLLLFSSVTSAANARSFCKCTCGTNSTIIPLIYEPPPPVASYLPENETIEEPQPKRTGTCTDCNRQFCVENRVSSMLICKEMREDQIFAQCFQRDSTKDEAVIYTFIIVTVGLLVYTGIRPWVRRRLEAAQERRAYASVASGQGTG